MIHMQSSQSDLLFVYRTPEDAVLSMIAKSSWLSKMHAYVLQVISIGLRLQKCLGKPVIAAYSRTEDVVVQKSRNGHILKKPIYFTSIDQWLLTTNCCAYTVLPSRKINGLVALNVCNDFYRKLFNRKTLVQLMPDVALQRDVLL